MEERERRGPNPKGERKPRLTSLDVKEINHLLVTSNQIASGTSSDGIPFLLILFTNHRVSVSHRLATKVGRGKSS